TVRTAASVAQALDMIADRAPQFALLDVGLVREKSFAVAERLDALKIPFAFVTGYGAMRMFPTAFAHKPTLPKPYSSDALRALLTRRSHDRSKCCLPTFAWPDFLPRLCYPGFGSSVVDHSATSARSRNVT